MEIRTLIRYAIGIVVVWAVFANVWPAYSGAIKVRKALIQSVQATTPESMRAEVVEKALDAVNATGVVEGLRKSDITASRENGKWVVGVAYETQRKLYGDVYVIYSFDLANDRKLPWVRDQAS